MPKLNNKLQLKPPSTNFYTPIPFKYSGYTQSPRQSMQLEYLTAALPVVFKTIKDEKVQIIEKNRKTREKQLSQTLDQSMITQLTNNGRLNPKAKLCVSIINGQKYYSPSLHKLAESIKNYDSLKLQKMINQLKNNQIKFGKPKTEEQIELEISKLAEEISFRDKEQLLKDKEKEQYQRKQEHSPEKCILCMKMQNSNRNMYESCRKCKAKLRSLSTPVNEKTKKKYFISKLEEFNQSLHLQTLLQESYPKQKIHQINAKKNYYRPDLVPSIFDVYQKDRYIYQL